MEFVEADLSKSGWHEVLKGRKFDAVMSTTALHWLKDATLRNVYGEIYNLLGESGIFLNGNHLYPESEEDEVTARLRWHTFRTEVMHKIA